MLSPVKNITFGAPIMDVVEVEDRLRRAQRAILNPSSEPSVFLLASDDEYNPAELTFSPNFVSVEISGPNVADLSFCDLPGIFHMFAKAPFDLLYVVRSDRQCNQRRRSRRCQTRGGPTHFIHRKA